MNERMECVHTRWTIQYINNIYGGGLIVMEIYKKKKKDWFKKLGTI